MKRPGKMIKEVIKTIFKKPATTRYPYVKSFVPEKFRGRIVFTADKCIGCKMCMRDCPANAIVITKVGDKQFECEIDMGKCVYCAQCVDSCLKKALESSKDFELASVDRKSLKVRYHGGSKKST